MGDKTINTRTIFVAETITKGSDSTTDAIDLKNRPEGYFSLQVSLTGSGTAKIEYTLSNSGSDYLTPSTAENIVTAHTDESGPGADGKDIYIFEPEMSKFLKIKVTETGGASSIVVTITLAIQ